MSRVRALKQLIDSRHVSVANYVLSDFQGTPPFFPVNDLSFPSLLGARNINNGSHVRPLRLAAAFSRPSYKARL
jgi:hypothetical protein